jgi:hypothetical protein
MGPKPAPTPTPEKEVRSQMRNIIKGWAIFSVLVILPGMILGLTPRASTSTKFFAPVPNIASGGTATITAESITPTNNTPDPDETVTASFPVINTGNAPTTNLVGTLQSGGGVTPITGPRTYGVVTPGGGPVSQSFTFVTSGSCGSTITATIQFQDDAVNLGTVTYTFHLGTTSSSTSTFSNDTSIKVPGSGEGLPNGAPSLPYPSNITVAGLTGSVTKVAVTLKNMDHTFPDDVDVLLVGPTGRKMIIQRL